LFALKKKIYNIENVLIIFKKSEAIMAILEFKITGENFEKLDNMRKKSGSHDIADFLNNALSLLKWAAEEGRHVVAVDEEQGKIIRPVMPALEKTQGPE
jgi:hypothetical protein